MGTPVNDGNDIVVVEGVRKYTTTKATLLTVGDELDKHEYWFPNSQMKKNSVLLEEENKEWAIFVPKWLMKDKPKCNYEEYNPKDWPAHTCDKETGEIPDPDDDILF